MALRLASSVANKTGKLSFLRGNGFVVCLANNYHGRAKIGDREVVGFGINGEYSYTDRIDFPAPAIRFKEIKGDLVQLKEKEKGDWKKLSIDEKKKLYRASFCRTFAECDAPTGEWKSVLAGVLLMSTVALWLFVATKKYISGPLPESCSPEWKQKQLEYMIALRVDPIEGISSKWDYEKNRWKE